MEEGEKFMSRLYGFVKSEQKSCTYRHIDVFISRFSAWALEHFFPLVLYLMLYNYRYRILLRVRLSEWVSRAPTKKFPPEKNKKIKYWKESREKWQEEEKNDDDDDEKKFVY